LNLLYNKRAFFECVLTNIFVNIIFDFAAMIPILLYILYKKKGKDISRAAKKVIGKAKTKRLLKKAEKMSRTGNKLRRRPIKNAYSKFRHRRLNRKRVGN
jgi:predicted membrane protein